MSAITGSNSGNPLKECDQLFQFKQALSWNDFKTAFGLIDKAAEEQVRDLLILKIAKAAITLGIEGAPQPEVALRLAHKLSSFPHNKHYFEIFSSALNVAEADSFKVFIEAANQIPDNKESIGSPSGYRDSFLGALAVALKRKNDKGSQEIFDSIQDPLSRMITQKDLENVKPTLDDGKGK